MFISRTVFYLILSSLLTSSFVRLKCLIMRIRRRCLSSRYFVIYGVIMLSFGIMAEIKIRVKVYWMISY